MYNVGDNTGTIIKFNQMSIDMKKSGFSFTTSKVDSPDFYELDVRILVYFKILGLWRVS